MSSVSTIPLFGHAYSLTVQTLAGEILTFSSNGWSPEALRITFDVELAGYQAMWQALICIYNLNDATTQTLITQGALVSLSGGYQTGNNYGTLYEGKVLRVMFEKENVTDYKLTLQCVVGMEEIMNSLVSYATGPFQSQSSYIALMAKNASTPFQIGNINSQLNNVQLPCPKVFFGTPKFYIEQAARQNNMTWTFGPKGLFVDTFNPDNPVPDLIYSSAIPVGDTATTPQQNVSYSIQGTPQQVDRGVTLRVALDARVQINLPPVIIKIDNTVIRQQPIFIGSLPPVLSKDGIYAVVGVRHVGDSRGNTWTTEIHGVILTSQLAALGYSQPNADIRNSNPGTN